MTYYDTFKPNDYIEGYIKLERHPLPFPYFLTRDEETEHLLYPKRVPLTPFPVVVVDAEKWLSNEGFDLSKSCFVPFLDKRKPYYWPFLWGEQGWLEWIKTPMGQTLVPKRVHWADQCKNDPKRYKYYCGALKSCFKTPPKHTIHEYGFLEDRVPANRLRVYYKSWESQDVTIRPGKPSFRRDPINAAKSSLEGTKETLVKLVHFPEVDAEPQTSKRVHWKDEISLQHHLFFKKKRALDKVNPIGWCIRDWREVKQIKAEQLVQPGPCLLRRIGMCIKTRVLRLPTHRPTASTPKSCLKVLEDE